MPNYSQLFLFISIIPIILIVLNNFNLFLIIPNYIIILNHSNLVNHSNDSYSIMYLNHSQSFQLFPIIPNYSCAYQLFQWFYLFSIISIYS